MTELKERYRDSFPTGRARLHHLPGLTATFPQRGVRTTNNPHQATPYATNLKNEALYLASILRARLSDSVKCGDGRGLLSRALARGELDQFLVAFFRDPANLLFAKEKVEERKNKISKMAARLLAPGGKMAPGTRQIAAGGSVGEGDMDSNSNYSSAIDPEFNHGPNVHQSMGCGRFGPVLADAGGNFNILPARYAMDKGIILLQGDDVSELGSTASRVMTEHDDNESYHGHGRRHHHQQHNNEVESVRSRGSLSTVHSECDGSSYATATSLGGSTTMSMDVSGGRGKVQRGRRKRQDLERNHKRKSTNNFPLCVVESTHFEGHMLRRVCEVTGKVPGGVGGSTHSDYDSDDERTEFSLLEDSGEHQLAMLRRNPEMMRILVRLKALSGSLVDTDGRGVDPGLAAQPGGAGNAVGGRRVDKVRLAQQEYLRLFEEMLGELLKTQRKKSTAFRAEKRAFQRELERAREVETAMRGEAEVHAVQLEALLAVKKALATEVATQEIQLNDLAAEVETRVRMEEEAKREHFAAEAKKTMLLNELKQEEQTLRTRLKEVEIEATRAEMGVRSMEHLAAKVKRTAVINKRIYRVDETKYKLIKETAENFCQTTANDDGLWDYQDGLTRQVSRNALQRIKWQAVRRFATCPSCHGLAQHTTVKRDKDQRKLVPSKDRALEDPTLVHEHFQQKQNKTKRRGNFDKAWAMPNGLVEFMCHLPRTAMALPIKPLRWIIREIWLILDERERIDAMDEQEGQAVQSMNDFMVELFLRRHSLRQDAELQLYIFLVSDKKDHVKREEEVLEQEVQPHESHLGAAFIPVLLFTRRALLKRAKVDPRALRHDAIQARFKSATSLVRLRDEVMRAFKGSSPPPDVQPSTNDDGGEAAAGDVKATTAPPGPDPSTASTALTLDESGARDRGGAGGGGGGGGGGLSVDNQAADPLAPTSEAVLEPVIEVIVGGGALAARSEGFRKAAADAANNGSSSSSNNYNNNSGAGIPSRGSGATGGPLAPKKSVVGATFDRNKKKTSPTAKSSGGAGNGAQGTTKKSQGSSSSGAGKNSGAPLAMAADERDSRDWSGHTEVVEAIELPVHVLTEDNCTFWISLEMAVRVLTVVLHWCPPMKRHAYMRSIEKHAALLTSRGHVTGVEASHSFIRSAMRKTITAVEASGAGNGNDYGDDGSIANGITETLGGFIGTFEEGCGVGGVVSGDAALHDARVIIDMERVVELVMEVVLLRQNLIENRLRTLFTEGDENGDGVLSFEEFNRIINRVAPHFSERRVLRMFREALTSGSEGSFAIEKDTFCNVCRQHDLVQLLDFAHLERATGRDYAGATRLRLLGNVGCPAETAAAVQTPHPTVPASTVTAPASAETAPQKVEIDVAVGVPRGGEAVKQERQEGEEEEEQAFVSAHPPEYNLEGDAGANASTDDGSNGDVYAHGGNDQLSQGDRGFDKSEKEHEEELVSFLEAENAPSYLFFQQDGEDERYR